MPRRALSLDLRFPLLIVTVVLVTGAVFAVQSYRLFADVLYRSNAARLHSNAALVEGMLSSSLVPARRAVSAVADAPGAGRFLAAPEPGRAAAELEARIRSSSDTLVARTRLLDLRGATRLSVIRAGMESLPSWADSVVVELPESADQPSVSPLLAFGRHAVFEVVAPVRLGDARVGYAVQTYVVRGVGADAVRRLAEAEVLIIGQPDAGGWTDLESVVAGPPVLTPAESTYVFDASASGPGLGVAHAIDGTPWMVWMQRPRAQVLGPLDQFVGRMLPLALILAVGGAIVAWYLSRGITRQVVALTNEIDAMEGGHGPVAAPPSGDEILRLRNAFHDMAARAQRHKETEQQLMQAQKLEAVGRLAGGIAHDFNNVLTVVTNYADLVQHQLDPASEAARDVGEIIKASSRASRLTQQLLAFSRRQALQPVRLDLNDVLRGTERMLERLLPSRVGIELELGELDGPVLADAVQVEQVVFNLALNASDAMPEGGRLVLRTAMAELDDPQEPSAPVPDPEVRTRRFILLVVRDTGAGMDRETLAKVFEPFFTTKAAGKGTGLGLASVHGIMMQLGGNVWVYSEPGKGTTFKLYFPVADVTPDATSIAPPPRTTRARRGSGRILLVEDDPDTLAVTRRVLVRQGYEVLVAMSGDEAIAVLERLDELPRLVLSDVMMPVMDGHRLARSIKDRWPALPVVLMSGYTDVVVAGDALDPETVEQVEKPFTSANLLGAVDRALNAAAARSAGPPPNR